MGQKKRLLIVVGPTASGKSALAVELAQKYNGEIISADSRQVYRGLDIGTGKIAQEEMGGIPHHLLDVESSKKVFTAQHFISDAKRSIDEITGKGKLPILCGGTGFYIDALVGRVPIVPVEPNPALRKELEQMTMGELFSLLGQLDPKRAYGIDKFNSRRLIRSIEIAKALGRNPKTRERRIYDALWIGIRPSADVLRERINKRLRERLDRGMIEEAKKLNRSGLSYKRMDALGLEYRSLARYLQ